MKKPTPQDLANAAPVVVPMSVLTFRYARLACTTRKKIMLNPKKWDAHDCVLKHAQSNTNSTLRTVHCCAASQHITPTRMCALHKKSRSRNVMTPWSVDPNHWMIHLGWRKRMGLPRSTGDKQYEINIHGYCACKIASPIRMNIFFLSNSTTHLDSARKSKTNNQRQICRAANTKMPFVDPKRNLIERK